MFRFSATSYVRGFNKNMFCVRYYVLRAWIGTSSNNLAAQVSGVRARIQVYFNTKIAANLIQQVQST